MSGIAEYIQSKLREYQKKGIKDDGIEFYTNLENFIKVGVLRILYCLYNANLRMSEIQHLTKLSTSNVVTSLRELQNRGIVEKFSEKVEKPRKGEVSFYKLTKIGKKLTEELQIQAKIEGYNRKRTCQAIYNLIKPLQKELEKK